MFSLGLGFWGCIREELRSFALET